VAPATFRLIACAHHKPPVLRLLVDTEEEESLLAQIEGLTSKRLKAERSGLLGLDQRELLYQAWGQTYVNAAFAYTRHEGNRFNDGSRGAWYCAFDDMTPLYEVAHHRTRELERVGRFLDEGIYVQLLAAFVGVFHDLGAVTPVPACLHSDPDLAYTEGQKLALKLRSDGSRGLLYPSVRHAGGQCLAAFEPNAVQNVRQGARWRIEWSGSPAWSATAL
jgi:RES domain-containing protein